jgi:hypothetical protein
LFLPVIHTVDLDLSDKGTDTNMDASQCFTGILKIQFSHPSSPPKKLPLIGNNFLVARRK